MNITVLGSTGSIGRSALNVFDNLPGAHTIYALSTKSNIDLLRRQIVTYKPHKVWVEDQRTAQKLKDKINHLRSRVEVCWGNTRLAAIASHTGSDCILIALVGAAGLLPLLAAIRARKKIALANKESLVIAGDLVMKEARTRNVSIIPVDSEHSAIFQCIQNSKRAEIKKIILTASGGPFYKNKKSLKNVSIQQALAHPNWKMGKKITIDSATLMNKGLEAIEAHHLFGIPMDNIEVLIHPQSIVHSLVEFVDGSVLAQLSKPDMRGPIQYALTYPSRQKGIVRQLNLSEIQKLEFYKPDFKRFPCLGLAIRAGKAGGSMPVVLNAANEVAVEAFLDGNISLDKIAFIVGAMLKKHKLKNNPQITQIKDILNIDNEVRTLTRDLIYN
ncbi:MAG: 1-deoxy-D-xylulose-5-phosphate reductoisomerase [bacterium]